MLLVYHHCGVEVDLESGEELGLARRVQQNDVGCASVRTCSSPGPGAARSSAGGNAAHEFGGRVFCSTPLPPSLFWPAMRGDERADVERMHCF